MRLSRTALFTSVIFLFLSLTVTASEIITNETVVAMTKSGLGEELIISKIKASSGYFDVSTADILGLKKEGVGDNVIKLMIEIADKTGTIAKEEIQKGESEEQYKKAMGLKGIGDFNSAHDILKKLADENPGDSRYQLGYVDILVEHGLVLKEAKNPGWKRKAKEAGYKLNQKKFFKSNARNPDYYLVYAKYSWLIEENRDAGNALEKAFYFKPDNPDAYILKGDIYLHRSKNTKPSEPQQDMTTSASDLIPDKRDSLAKLAKISYESALSIPELSTDGKAYIYYKIGELEDQIYRNDGNAKKNWEKAISLNPDSRTGKLAKERLNKQGI